MQTQEIDIGITNRTYISPVTNLCLSICVNMFAFLCNGTPDLMEPFDCVATKGLPPAAVPGSHTHSLPSFITLGDLYSPYLCYS